LYLLWIRGSMVPLLFPMVLRLPVPSKLVYGPRLFSLEPGSDDV